MSGFLGTLPAGLVTGAVYALLAMGLVFIYKATRVPNFAYGAMATFVAFFHYSLVAGRPLTLHVRLLFVHLNWHAAPKLPFWEAVPVSLLVAALLGLVIERLVIRPFARASMVTNIIVTLALSLLLTAITQQFYGARDLIVPNRQAIFPRTAAFALGAVKLSWEDIGVIGLVVALAAVVYVFFRLTATGLAIRAVATDRDTASLLGVSVRRLSVASWVGGSMVAGLAGIALASLVVASNPSQLLLLTIKGFAAAIVGGLTSFPIAVTAGFLIGWGEELARHYLSGPHPGTLVGAPEVLTLGLVITVLALRPRWIFKGIRDDEDAGLATRPGAAGTTMSAVARWIDPTEAYRLLRAAVPTTGRLGTSTRWLVRAALGLAAVFAVSFPAWPLPHFWTLPADLTLIYLLVVLSFVVIIGWLGQISLAQGAFLGVGGAGTAICVNVMHLPFPLPLVGAVMLSIPVSILVGLPALRLRGVHLAVATLAFGLAAEEAILPRFKPGIRILLPHALRSDGARYELFLALTVAAFIVAWRVNCTRVGRSFRALRDSETVACAYGIRPVRTKLTGFVVSGAFAALAGAMITYELGSFYGQYGTVEFSITWLVQSVLVGITSIAGPLIGAILFGLYPELTKSAVSIAHLSFVPEIAAAAGTIIVLAILPEGLASVAGFVRHRVSAHEENDDLLALQAAAPTTAGPAAAPAPEVAEHQPTIESVGVGSRP